MRYSEVPNCHKDHVKQIAHSLDPKCWESYSGKPKREKMFIDQLRSRALDQAAEQWADNTMLIPTEDISALHQEISDLKIQLEGEQKHNNYLESMRPHWAEGHTSDSIAAQASTAALSSIWDFLEVDSQTMAMQKLNADRDYTARATRVLARFSNIINNLHDFDKDLEFKGDQGSERREFEHGQYCGRTILANELRTILLDKQTGVIN